MLGERQNKFKAENAILKQYCTDSRSMYRVACIVLLLLLLTLAKNTITLYNNNAIILKELEEARAESQVVQSEIERITKEHENLRLEVAKKISAVTK